MSDEDRPGAADSGADERPTDPFYVAGMRVRREVLGDAHVDRASADPSSLTTPFQEFITRSAWGQVWTREELDRRTRSAITLALLCALGHERELAMHVAAARRNGLSAEEIAEVLLHTAVYAGVPAANTGLAIARRVLEEEGAGGERHAGDDTEAHADTRGDAGAQQDPRAPSDPDPSE